MRVKYQCSCLDDHLSRKVDIMDLMVRRDTVADINTVLCTQHGFHSDQVSVFNNVLQEAITRGDVITFLGSAASYIGKI